MKTSIWLIPLKLHFEKSGSFTNFKGLRQNFKKVCDLLSQSFDLLEVVEFFENPSLERKETIQKQDIEDEERKTNYFVRERGSL